MSNFARLMREQARRERVAYRQAFRAVAARNTPGPLLGVEMQGLAGEAVSGELFQHYGYASAPLPGAEYIAIPVGGNSRHTVVVASEDGRYRLRLQDGEVALYTDEGDRVHMKRGRVVEVVTDTLRVTAGTKVIFDTPLVETTADLKVGGQADVVDNVTVGGDVAAGGQVADSMGTMVQIRTIYNGHNHGSWPPPNQPM